MLAKIYKNAPFRGVLFVNKESEKSVDKRGRVC